MNKNIFGTDGVRGVANTEISGDFAFRLGQAFAVYLSENSTSPNLTICVGRDTRPSGYMLLSAFVAGVMTMGVNVLDVGVAPTPAISYLTSHLHYSAGAVITASHNLSEYNGIKLMDAHGAKLSTLAESDISRIFCNITDYLPSTNVGLLTQDWDKPKLWADYLIKCVDNVNLSNFRVVVDCAHGAGFRAVPYVLKSLGANVTCLNCDDDGGLINLNCGSTCLAPLLSAMQSNIYDIGLAFDGDADRLVVCDSSGNVLSGDDILFVLAKYFADHNLLKSNTIVATIVSNHGLEQSLSPLGILVRRVDVGDKFVLHQLLAEDYSLGGEDSGHIIMPQFNLSADALLTALFLLKILQSTNSNLTQLTAEFQRFPRATRNVPVSARQHALLSAGALAEPLEQLLRELGDAGTIILRPSGTESMARVLVEGNEPSIITNIADKLQSLILAL